MKIPEYELRRYKTIVENKKLLREKMGVETVLYAAHNATVLADAKAALATGKIRTPSLPSSESEEKEELDCDSVEIGSCPSTGGVGSSGEEYRPRRKESGEGDGDCSASKESAKWEDSETLSSVESDSLEESGENCCAFLNDTDSSGESIETTESRGGSGSNGVREESIPVIDGSVRRGVPQTLPCTQSRTHARRGALTSATAEEEDIGATQMSKKPVEAFVPWKNQTLVGGQRAGAPSTASKSGGRAGKRNMTMSAKARGGQASLVSRRVDDIAPSRNASRATELSAGKSRQLDFSGSEERIAGACITKRNEVSTILRKADASMEKAGRISLPTCGQQSAVSSALQSPLQTKSANIVKTLGAENYSPKTGHPTSTSQSLHIAVGDRSTLELCGRGVVAGDDRSKKVVTSRDVETPTGNRCRRSESPTGQEVQSNGSDADNIDHGDDKADSGHPDEETQEEAIVFPSESVMKNAVVESKENRAAAEEVQEVDLGDAEYDGDMRVLAMETESRRRRERRQAQSMRQREGDKRKKEGRPRNFLLVDEYTRKPYGVGVGDWRKELMLLSHKLDPAVGNINQHPEGAVAEIVDWIQHTWEYSSPLRFEYVKEVIACGVTLRRAEIWRKLRNDEPKPEDVTDRSWRTLSRQMQSPAQMKKFENCSRANASCSNFGRTGPSSEVGVRQRLRRALRRSPDPHEIQLEMARDKGYGGYDSRRKGSDKVMHRSEGTLDVYEGKERVGGSSANAENNTTAVQEDDGHVHGGGDKLTQTTQSAQSTDKVNGDPVLAMIAEQIAQHPLVMRMMQRLEALEGRQIVAIVDGVDALIPSARSRQRRGGNERRGKQMRLQQVEDEGNDVQGDEGEGAPEPRHRRKRQRADYLLERSALKS